MQGHKTQSRGEVVTWERECANLCHVLRIHDCHDRYPPYHCRYDDRAGHCVDVSRSRVFTVSLYRVWIVYLCGDVGGGEIQVRLPAPGLRLSSPTAALQPLPVTTSLHRAEKLTTTFLPSYHHRLGLGCICTAISSLKWLCPLCCVSGTISSPAAILCQ